MTITGSIADLISFWERVLGNPPSKEQFAIWAELHSLETMHRAILKTAIKNQKMGGSMTQDHRERFASKVMDSRTNDRQKAAGQRCSNPTERRSCEI
jgi:hypothetical protein